MPESLKPTRRMPLDGRPGGKRRALVVAVATAVALACASCGGGGGGGDGSARDFEVREAVTDALANDRAIDTGAASVIEAAASGSIQLDAAIDTLVDQTKSLLAVIESVAAPGEPPDRELSRARELTGEYLRNRVHQVELALSAATPAELQALYAEPAGDLEAEREEIVKLLLAHDPGLEEFVR